MTMRKSTFLIIVLLKTFALSAQTASEPLFDFSNILRQKVDSCTILKWSKDKALDPDVDVVFDRVKMKMIVRDTRTSMLIEFLYNKDTLLMLQNLYALSKEGKKLVSRDSFFYNEKKQKVRYKSVNFIKANEPPIEATYLYRNDTLITEVYTYGMDIFRTIVYTYNKKLGIKQKTILSSKATENYFFVYNQQQQLVSYYRTGLSSTDTLFEHRYKYDVKGRLIETEIYDNTGKLQHMYRKQYLDNGLFDLQEDFLLIKNGQLETALYQKKAYRYGYRKTK